MVATFSNLLKERRTGILACLKAEGRMSVDQIASALAVSRVCIRRHLDLLRRDGLVAFDIEHHDRGRPGHRYFLTDKAGLLFPTAYTTFALRVLDQVRVQIGERGVGRVLRGQADDVIRALQTEFAGASFDQKIRRLRGFLNKRGFDVSLQRRQDGSYVLKQRNCPVVAIASSYSQICDEELRTYVESLGVEVVRDCCIAAGARSCDYRVEPPPLRSRRRRRAV
ncbi:MAG TPA: HTH domain-containing protein [Blastocatellia bacterium]|nr:HTH domain-containing protein [Blastocatellia bacterium]